jgi:hypothetical protein
MMRRRWCNGTTKNGCYFSKCIEDGRAKVEGRVGWRGRLGLKKVKKVFGDLFEIGGRGELGKWDLLGKKVDFEDITLVHGVFEVALVATVVLKGWSNIPPKFAMQAERGAGVSRDVGNHASSEWGDGSGVKVKGAI